ncbi:hypothetical protein C8J56DRAFT_1137847 [Mycena floridula]|nr:hypothetical protein C8J56DRAFT_1137847 [Mycena floridula]
MWIYQTSEGRENLKKTVVPANKLGEEQFLLCAQYVQVVGGWLEEKGRWTDIRPEILLHHLPRLKNLLVTAFFFVNALISNRLSACVANLLGLTKKPQNNHAVLNFFGPIDASARFTLLLGDLTFGPMPTCYGRDAQPLFSRFTLFSLFNGTEDDIIVLRVLARFQTRYCLREETAEEREVHRGALGSQSVELQIRVSKLECLRLLCLQFHNIESRPSPNQIPAHRHRHVRKASIIGRFGGIQPGKLRDRNSRMDFASSFACIIRELNGVLPGKEDASRRCTICEIIPNLLGLTLTTTDLCGRNHGLGGYRKSGFSGSARPLDSEEGSGETLDGADKDNRNPSIAIEPPNQTESMLASSWEGA